LLLVFVFIRYWGKYLLNVERGKTSVSLIVFPSYSSYCAFSVLHLCSHTPKVLHILFYFWGCHSSLPSSISGDYENDPLSEFIVFEIPTFLNFSILITAIHGWKTVMFKKSFFPDEYFVFI
jgi:hypothetical protein